MTSKVESTQQEGIKLPSVVTGHSCLVSPASSVRSANVTPRDIATLWAAELRKRINESIECHENVNEDDMMTLERELIGIFISTLQQHSRFQWSVFVEILLLIAPYKEFFYSKAEICHYIERILYHVNVHRESLFDLQVESILMKVFPEYVREVKAKGAVMIKNYCSQPVSVQSTRSPISAQQQHNQAASKPHQYPGKNLLDDTNPYRTCIHTDEVILGTKQLTMRDLNKSMSTVALEMASRETIWGSPLGTTALALATVLPDTEYTENKEDVCGTSAIGTTSQTIPLASRYGVTPHPVPKMEEEVPIMNGREAVKFFVGCHHLGKIKSLCFNLVPSLHYNPYNLISVSKRKANPEHYIFSTFGVLHVYPDRPCESLSLAEWQREAVLWNAVSKIPFFKNFLRAKAFHRWCANSQYTEFQRLQRRILRNLLPASPLFGAALLQIARLLKELLTVPFLPMDIDKTYQLGEFENCINYKIIQAEKLLDRFHKYCKMILDFTAEGAFKKLHHCEEQVRKKTVFTKDSMYLQKKKKQERENNLKNAKKEAAFLGNFVKLVDYMIVEHMFEIIKTQGMNFIHTVLETGSNAPREGFFKAILAFSKHDTLRLSPSKKHFQKALSNCLLGLPSILVSKVDGCVTENGSQDRNIEIQNDGLRHLNNPPSNNNQSTMEIKRDAKPDINSSTNYHNIGKISEQVPQQGKKSAGEDRVQEESKRMVDESVLSLPDLPQQKIPTKQEDNLGTATPDLVIRHARNYTLQVEGEVFMGLYSSLSKTNLEEKLLMDEDYQAAIKKEVDLMSAAFEEIDNYCKINSWLNELYQFCHKWTETSLQEFRGIAASAIEQKLTDLRQWSDRVRNFDSSYVTENGLFYIDCSVIQENLLSKLDDVYQQLVSFITEEVQSLAKCFADEMSAVVKNMKDKKLDVSSFAVFAKNFGDYKKNTFQFQQRVEYIKSLYEVIRMSTNQMAHEEEKIEEKVLFSWEAFLMQIQDASEFVSTQTPLMTQQLEDKFQYLCREASLQAELATTGQFLQPNENPFKILADMKQIREKFVHAQMQLQEASQWRKSIAGESYNLHFLNEMTLKMDVRQELWKYVETSTATIKDWKKMLFKKINIKKALEKVTEWQMAARQLKSLLPDEDQVLTAWLEQIQEFSKDLPFLHKLENDALQERHWHAIFLRLNESYDSNHHFTVAELMYYNLSDHADIIDTIYKCAVAEYDLRQSFNRITVFWQDQEFKLAKHIPDGVFAKNKEPAKRTMSGNKRLRKLERFSQERAAASQCAEQRCLDVTNDDLFILTDLEELKYHLEDSRISVDVMLASPYVGDIRDQVVYWCQALREIEEIADLWIECQNKWLFMLKLFERADIYCKLQQQALRFEEVHNKFKDWMRVVSNDSRCLSVVNRRRGEKGYRILQGDNLRSLLLYIIKEQEEILKDLEAFIERSRTNFPRLYFLSNLEIVDLLGVSRNLPALIPFVRKCFPNVQDLTFALPAIMSGLNSHRLDHSINSDKLEVVNVQGVYDEVLPLYTRVEATSSPAKWMHSLNEILKNTLTFAMRACLQAKIEEGSRQPILILEEIANLDSSGLKQETANSEVKPTFQHWLLRFPAQCVITTEAIMWERGMTRALEKQDRNELIMLRSSMCAKLDHLVDVLQKIQSRFQIVSCDRKRIELLICGLLNQCIYHRDITEKLIENNQVRDSAFDWLKVLKFRMDVKNVLRAKTVVTENATGSNAFTKIKKKSSVSKKRKDSKVTTQETPKLTRTQTTVSTDYQFSTCYVQQLGNVFSYDYEYLGPSSHLVMTPLTERAFLAMGQALKTFYSGTLIGPTGTGKSETVRELARMLGRCIFTISCHESITFSVMLQYLTGMVQSGCWALFDDTDRLTKGLLSVAGQQLDYLRTALRALDVCSENQYQIRGHSHFDKKSGVGEKVIRRHSLTTLHPLPKIDIQPSPLLERQKTVPHGFNEKGLVTYFEDAWVAERDQRRHSIEREIEIKESDLYKSNKPPPLFYEHVKANRRRSPPDYSKLNSEPMYVHKMLGNVMLNGKLIQASSNFGCFMTLNANNPGSADIPYNFRVLMRPCALIVPDLEYIISVTLQSYGYKQHKSWTTKLIFFFKYLEMQMPKPQQHFYYLREVKRVLILAAGKRIELNFQTKITADDCGSENDDQWKPSSIEETSKTAEEHSLVYALKEILAPRFEKLENNTTFLHILGEVFPHAANQQAQYEHSSVSQQIIMTIKEVFKEDHLQYNDVMFNKILQLHSILETQTPVLLVGPSGSGKTKAYHILSRAINLLNYKLYAPGHSKDDLNTERDIPFQMTKNLKRLKDMDQNLKPKQSKQIHQPQKLEPNISLDKTILTANETFKKLPMDFAEYPKTDVVHLFPCTMTLEELLGTFDGSMWHGGLIGKIMRDSHFLWLAVKIFLESHKAQDRKNTKTLNSVLHRWLVLDGDLDPLWTEEVKTLLDDEKRLSLGNGESVLLTDTTSVIFETCDLKLASPSTISRCSVVHFGLGTTTWSALYFTWKQTASSKWLLSVDGLKILDDLVSDVFPSAVKFLTSDCQTALLTDLDQATITANHVVPGVAEVSCFLHLISAMLDRFLKRSDLEKKAKWKEADVKTGENSTPHLRQMGSHVNTSSHIETAIPNYRELLMGTFVFSFIWAFGGHLHDRFKEKFSKFAHDTLKRASHSVCLPSSGLVFDYYFDESTTSFVKWSDRHQQGYMKNLNGFFVIPEIDRYAYLLELLMSTNQPVLLTGAPGVGKTSLVQRMILTKMPSTKVTMSRGLTSSILQDLLVSHVLDTQSKSNTTVGTSMASINHKKQKHLFFIDDLSLASGVGGYNPNAELIRSILTVGEIYNKKRKDFQRMEEAAFIAATTLPSVPGSGLGHASHVISSRLTRHFINLTVFVPSNDALLNLYSRPLQTWLEEFPHYAVEHHYEFAKAMSEALIELYHLVKERLRPGPSQAHYVFSLHDLSRVMQGIMLLSPRTSVKKVISKEKVEQSGSASMMNTIVQLWCHEITRCFGDRIISTEDQTWFSHMVQDLVIKHFCSSREKTKFKEQSQISASNQHSPFGSPSPKFGTSNHNDEPEGIERVETDENSEDLSQPQSDSAKGLCKTSSTASIRSDLLEQKSSSSSVTTIQHRYVQNDSRSTVIETEEKIPKTGATYDGEDIENYDKTLPTSSDSGESHSAESDTESPCLSYTKTSPSLSAVIVVREPVVPWHLISLREVCCGFHHVPELTLHNREHFLDSLATSKQNEGVNSQLASPQLGCHINPYIFSQAAMSTKQSIFRSLWRGGLQSLKEQGSRNTQLGVTVKSSQILDKKHKAYFGPLLSIHDIKIITSNYKDIIFSKFFFASNADSPELQTEKGYTLQTEEVLSEALYSCLSKYNKATSQKLNLVFFSEAVHHAARLSRVLAHPKGHALLLGMSDCTGRATLVRLASFVAQCKLFELKPQFLSTFNLSEVRSLIKLSCFHAGINGMPTVLLVNEDMGEECFQDISAIMAEGTAPGIYKENEVLDIVSHMMPGGVQTKRVDKIQKAFDRFVRRVQLNLHIIVCINYKGNSKSTDLHAFHNKLQRNPNLIKNSFSIDLYMPWSFKALCKVAKVWLKDTDSGVIVPWNPKKRAEQIEMASKGMAYIHLSAKTALERQFWHSRDSLKMFTPLTFLEFVHLFKIVSAFLVQTEKAKSVQFEKALEKINEAFGSIAEYKRKVSDLMPQSNSAGGVLNNIVSQVETLKESYRHALNKCKSQEEKIIRLQEPLEKLRKSAQIEFDKVNPSYQAAVKVLDQLDHSAVEELRSYPSPPEGVKIVMRAVCLLFGKPQTWENAKSLMVDTSFFQELIFYKKDSIPDEVFTELKTFVNNPLFAPDNVAQASIAASSVCAWVHAVFAYSSIQQKMKPHMKSLCDAEHNLVKAQAQLGQLRVEAHQIKINLEQYINQHKEAMQAAKAIEKQILAIERKIARASHLMDNMSEQHFLWRSELKKARKKIISGPGDALITSASFVYHGPLDDKSRLDLLHDWVDHIKHNVFDAQAPHSKIVSLELPIKMNAQQGYIHQGSEDVSCYGAQINHSEISSRSALHIQIKTFKFTSAVYDSNSYYRSELKRQDTMQTAVPEDFMDDSDEDENCCLPTRPNLALQEIVSDFDELSDWRMQNLPTDLHSIQNALIMRACCHNHKYCWPLLIDPDNQAEVWVKALQNSQNVFTENDVANFVIDDAIQIENSNVHKCKQSVPEIIFSNVSEVIEHTSAESPPLNSSKLPITRKQDSQSGNTNNIEELITVTHMISNNCNSFSVDSHISISDTSFLVLSADDPNINSMLISAVIHGATILVTHLEQKPLEPLFRDLLMKKFYRDNKGNKLVMVGDSAIIYHPSFCLYLSTSVPLFVNGDGIYKFSLNHLCVINMAMSNEAITNQLMFEAMKVEKKEFENQRRSNENDIIIHRQRLSKENEIIREKTLNLPGPLLDDKTMIDSLTKYQANVEHNRQILEETCYMGDHLEGKFSHYLPFIQHSAMVYGVLHKISVLYPCYYLPFYKYVAIFATVMKNRDRGKGSIGAPQVRAQELSDAVLHAVFKYVQLMMFEEHYNLLSLLMCLERLLRQHKASNKELSLFVNGFLKISVIDESLLESRPHWMNNVTWIDCNILESLHQPFRGLSQSLNNNSHQWEEYFQNHVNLVSPVPGTTLQELSLFQKCLLWKLVCPHKMTELSQALILYELGSVVNPPDNYSIYEVYKLNDEYTPTVFLLPALKQHGVLDGTMGHTLACPASEIKQLAREIGMEGKVCIMNFGIASQMLEMKTALKECLRKGHWLLLQNYHLCPEPDPEFFNMLKDIIYARWFENHSNICRSETNDVRRSLVTSSHSPKCVNTSKIHQSFRLWITTTVNGERQLPGLLIQHGLRVTCETTANFKNLLCRTYKSAAFLMNANGEEMTQTFKRVMPLSLLHAIILQQCYYGRNAYVHNHFWTLADLATVTDIFQNLTGWTSDTDAIGHLTACVYARHCQDLSDVRSVQAISKDLIYYATHANQISSHEFKGVGLLLHRLVTSFIVTGNLQRTLDSIEDYSSRTISLPDEAEVKLIVCKSKILLKDLVQVAGAPELLHIFQNFSETCGSSLAANIIKALLDNLRACPELPETDTSQMNPLVSFFSQEVTDFKKLLQTVKNDLSILNRAVHAEISLTSKMQAMLEDVISDICPISWLESTFATCLSLKLWFAELPVRINYVKNCLIQCPPILSLNMFLRPDKLFWVIRQTHAEQKSKDVTSVTLDFQVMPEGLTPSMPPDRGVFIDGLQLKNASWDSIRSVLSENILCLHTVKKFPLLWVKPCTEVDTNCMHVKNKQYLCPLYSARDFELQSDSNLLWMIPLATLESLTLLAQRRVILTLTDVLS